MRINVNKCEQIDRTYHELRDENNLPIGNVSLYLSDGIHDTSVINGNWEVCKLKDLNEMIECLTLMKEAIEKETGLTW